MVVAAADRFTIENKKVKTYSDFATAFNKNPRTGLLEELRNEESVKQSLRNLILTQRTERFYRASTGTKLYSLLFDPVDEMTSMNIEGSIRETIRNSEPRAILQNLEVLPNPDYEMYIVKIVFSTVTVPDLLFDMSLVLRRVR